MDREIDLAKLVIIRNGLLHPFDVEDFARSVTNFKLDNIPMDIDAILLKKSIHFRETTMIVNSTRPSTRRIFTIAHELGHTFIPWHIGEFKCAIDEGGTSFSDIYFKVEREADRFAAELIAPRLWIDAMLQAGKSILDILKLIKSMGVSNYAACRILAERLPSNHMLAEIDSSTELVTYHFD